MDIKITIPSYRRPETCVKKTLGALKAGKFPLENVKVFLSDWGERNEYRRVMRSAGMGKVELVKGARGLAGNRKVALIYFPEGTPVVSLDDDIKCFYRFVNKKKMDVVSDAPKMFEDCFEKMIEEEAGIFGMYPVSNPFFMKEGVTTGLVYMEGAVYGFFNEHDLPGVSSTLPFKEDFERSILYYKKYGKNCRLDYYSYETKYWTEKGGLQADGDRNAESIHECCALLQKRFPDYCKMVYRKSRGFTDLKLEDRVQKEAEKLLKKMRR